MFRSVFRSAFRDTTRPVFGVGGGGETALQQAVIGAWDMQETTASDDLVPSKGAITIPAIGSPAVVSGLVTGFTARRTADDYFSVASNDVFLMPDTGVKTIRIWGIETDGSAANQGLFAKSSSANASSAGDEFSATHNSGSRIRAYIRNSADSATSNGVAGALALSTNDVFRYELQMREGDGITQYLYNLTTDTEYSGTISLNNFNRGSKDFQVGRVDTSSFGGSLLLLAIFNRALTTEEREADQTPTRFADLGK